jgi:uncharacterized protein YjbJ (UPF0337 family)
MSKQVAEGRRKRAEGEIKNQVGKAVGNNSERARGKVEKVEGRIQEAVGNAKMKARRR